jgi:uncharacterized protein (DUF1330 family)
MRVVNGLEVDPNQAARFFNAPDDGPFVMVNLLKFRERAQYADGSDAHLSGAEAFMRYGAAAHQLVLAAGGRPVDGGTVTGLIVGEVEELWDSIGLVEYPSQAAFQTMLALPEYKALLHHRAAGLAGQLGIRINRPKSA